MGDLHPQEASAALGEPQQETCPKLSLPLYFSLALQIAYISSRKKCKCATGHMLQMAQSPKTARPAKAAVWRCL